MKYRVVKISNNIEEYPDCAADTKEFPYLIKHVEDEMDIFIIAENGDFWEAECFFHSTSITEFQEIEK
ncbi:MAG: hypothetical protein KAJ55_03070 [Anaerolineales bacterium]|nr:hypothetical protein [Anaerolineales bacterium]